jgi:hypothetical protein
VEEKMKRILMLVLFTIVAVGTAASSAPPIADPNQDASNSVMYMYWSGRGTGAWQRFEIYYYPRSRTFEGRWWYDDDTHSGWIDGEAYEDIGGVGVRGRGHFGGDYAGAWDGTFYFRGECFGKTWAKTDPPGDGEFRGI